MSKTVEFLFDLGSPYSYLAWHQLPKVAAAQGAAIVYTPVLLGGIFQATGNASPAEVPAKARYLDIDLARWAQAWPVILLTLKDADGRTLGARALQPDDYLPRDERSVPIGPGQSAQMAVRIREPSANVVAFSFDFR